MGVDYLFQKALKILSGFTENEWRSVEARCFKISQLQKELIAAADTEMAKCVEKCKGLCCKNLNLDDVFTLWDFIFILGVTPEIKKAVQSHLNSFSSHFSGPCPFLADGNGPCIFKAYVKPELCVVTFCSDEKTVKKKAGKVSRHFFILCWAVQVIRLKRTGRKIFVRC